MCSRSCALILLAVASGVAPLYAQFGGVPADKVPLRVTAGKEPHLLAPVDAFPQTQRQGWTIGAGVQWRQIGKASFDSRPRANASAFPASAADGYQAEGNGHYSDGYVLADSSSGAKTWNWGYDNASQVQGDTLTLHGVSGGVTSSVVVSTLR